MLKRIGKIIRGQHDWADGFFTKGGKLEKLYPLWEAHDTFAFTPGETAKGSTHVRDAIDLKRMMSIVVLSLLPCVLMAMYNTGYQAGHILQVASESGVSDTALGLDVTAETVLPEGCKVPTTNDYVYNFIFGAAPNTEASGEDPGYTHHPSHNWRIPVLKMIGADIKIEGSFYENLTNPWGLFSCMIHGALYFLPIMIVTLAFGGISEAIFSIIRGHEINEGFLVTTFLYPLSLPATMPLWQVAAGIVFGVVIGKEIFGGTGKNFLNPALTARAFLYFSYAGNISGDSAWTSADGYSGATALGALANAKTGSYGETLSGLSGIFPGVENVIPNGLTWTDAFIGNMHGSMGETSTLACLIGAAILIFAGVGSWRIMVGVLAGMTLLSSLFCQMSFESQIYHIPMHWHLVIGGFAFGAVFMATDPVSAAMTDKGKYFYGFLIGFLTVVIRCMNISYAEGIMLAILFANCCSPVIDYVVVQLNIKRRMARNGA